MSYFECEILKGDTLRDILHIQYSIRSISDEHTNYIYAKLLEKIQVLNNGKLSGFKISEKIKLPMFVDTKFGCFPCHCVNRNVEIQSKPERDSDRCNVCLRSNSEIHINYISLGVNNSTQVIRLCDHCLELLKVKLGGARRRGSKGVYLNEYK